MRAGAKDMRWDRREWGERVHRREERWMCHQNLSRRLEWRQRRTWGHSRGSGAKLGDKTAKERDKNPKNSTRKTT